MYSLEGVIQRYVFMKEKVVGNEKDWTNGII